jgi:hypothetical protein
VIGVAETRSLDQGNQGVSSNKQIGGVTYSIWTRCFLHQLSTLGGLVYDYTLFKNKNDGTNTFSKKRRVSSIVDNIF